MVIKVLDKGYVRLARIMADILDDGSLRAVSDMSVADDARVSFAKRAENYPPERNKGLVRGLGTAYPVPHTNPFRGSVVQFEVKAPMVVRNQWYKYLVGSDHEEVKRDPFFHWGEVSRRYVSRNLEFYLPDEWRGMPETRRQGSKGLLSPKDAEFYARRLQERVSQGEDDYCRALICGVAPEQARLFLHGYSLYTTWKWTCSLQTVCRFLKERLAPDSQHEIRKYAVAVRELILPYFPEAVRVLVDDG